MIEMVEKRETFMSTLREICNGNTDLVKDATLCLAVVEVGSSGFDIRSLNRSMAGTYKDGVFDTAEAAVLELIHNHPVLKDLPLGNICLYPDAVKTSVSIIPTPWSPNVFDLSIEDFRNDETGKRYICIKTGYVACGLMIIKRDEYFVAKLIPLHGVMHEGALQAIAARFVVEVDNGDKGN